MKLTLLGLLAATATMVAADAKHCIAADNPIRGACLADGGKKKYGCTDGYCWKSCDSHGQWCWTSEVTQGQHTAAEWGDWKTCQTDDDCSDSFWCGRNKKGGLCPNCGCGCKASDGTVWAGGQSNGMYQWESQGYSGNCEDY
ncbi:hypothetical protein BDW42DRAFT_196973 [Aspergillus taichungensis]|uniref:Uncharacterized protein n=1 Tax=Aspergillus taichungensis TaxID=482145 RepID=A0A2J5HI55_9EURO|nr:hypothetical protein BDW42DRAFT_196973 [Aspergillus taichungensis]